MATNSFILPLLLLLSLLRSLSALTTATIPSAHGIWTRSFSQRVAPSLKKTFRLSGLYASEAGKEAEEWFTCKILSNLADGIGLRLIDIEVYDDLVGNAYSTPGQYLKLKTDDSPDTKPSFLAIASPPSSKTFSFLIKENENNVALTSIQPGSTVKITKPMGGGYRTADAFDAYKFDFPVNNVYMLACGSGIAPIAATIESKSLNLGNSGPTSFLPREGTLLVLLY
jgi:hypothetical protein